MKIQCHACNSKLKSRDGLLLCPDCGKKYEIEVTQNIQSLKEKED